MENRAIQIDFRKNRYIHAPKRSNPLPSLFQFVNQIRREPAHDPYNKPRGLQRMAWGLDYHFEDAGQFSLDGTTWRRRERGTAHLYSPLKPYWERSSAREVPYTETYIVFHATNVSDLDALVSPGKGFARFTDRCDAIRPIVSELMKTADAGGGYWLAQSALYGILDRLLAAENLGGGEYVLKPTDRETSALSERVDDYLREHYHLHLTLDLVAHAAGVSRSTLTHKYRYETGTTPMARLTEIRLGVARSMILRGEPFKVIAAQTGFYDEFHFSNAFREHFGIPPSHYTGEGLQHHMSPPHAAMAEKSAVST